jgi:tryptophanyl-tRNA synthetase
MNNHSRVVSAMRPTGRLHIGHYHGVIKNWLSLQYEQECLFMVADLHALTTIYDSSFEIEDNIYNMVIDWLACGVDPSQAVIFIQSQIKEHAELNLLLSMITPRSWLERVPSYRDTVEKLENKDIDTHGFLGYPLLQSADILLYQAKYVPVGEDQLLHIKLAKEIARRFNFLYGREDGFEQKAHEAIKRLGLKKAAIYEELLTKYQQNGEDEALDKARYLLHDAVNLSSGDKERLFAFLENKSRVILTEPEGLITNTPKLLGLDGQKMSKSYGNTIGLREDKDSVSRKIKAMQTDSARVRRIDKGDPNKCPVWTLHRVYSNEEVCNWVVNGCTTAEIGCLDCKMPLIDSINHEQDILRDKAQVFLEDASIVRNILADGAEKAADIAADTMREVKEAMHLNY